MLRELLLPEGGFASAQDADTDGVEGLTFTWTEEEGAPAGLLEPFEHGRSIIRGEVDEETRIRLLELREQRPKPLRDDKAIASWNGLALAALAEAGRRLERPDWVEAARDLGAFLLGPLSGEDGRLRRSRREGRTSGPGYLDDYANVAHGLIELHVATGELRWLEEANRLARLAVELFADDEHGGFFLSPVDGERLVARTKDLDDHPLPSGNAMLAHVLLRLARIYGDDELERRGVARAPARAAGARAGARRLRLGALRARPAPEPAARARHRRPSRVGGRAGGSGAVAAEHRRCGRAGGRDSVARRQVARRREACGVRVRAVRLPGARHRSGGIPAGGLTNRAARCLSQGEGVISRTSGPLFTKLKGRTFMRRVTLAGLALIGALLLAIPSAFAQSDLAAADPGITSKQVVIGGSFPLTGPASSYAPIPAGMKAYFSYINARRGPDGKRGIGGRQVTFKFYDDGYNPVNSVQQQRKLVEQDKVFAVVGTLGTEVNQAVRALSEPAEGAAHPRLDRCERLRQGLQEVPVDDRLAA